jgi:hypothetical protein
MIKLKIMAYLQDIQVAARVPRIAQVTGERDRDVQSALIELDDEGMVIMRNGWYLASAQGMNYNTNKRGP